MMLLKGWVQEEEYKKAVPYLQNNQKYQLNFVDEKCPQHKHNLVFREWKGYLNLNLTNMIEGMEHLKQERNIGFDDEIRIVFWFDN